MIRLGLCVAPEALDAEFLAAYADIGYDYVETSLAGLAALSDADFDDLLGVLQGARTRAEACNSMLPGTLRLTGPNADIPAAIDFARFAFARANRLGVERVVFGSAGARNVPEGFPMDRAYAQIAEFLRALTKEIPSGMRVCVEPLRPQESNIITQLSGAAYALRLAGNPENIGLLADFYHMSEQKESMEGVLMAGDRLWHAHIARPGDRNYPEPADGSVYDDFFAALRQIGYSGRVSIEGVSQGILSDADIAYGVLDALRA